MDFVSCRDRQQAATHKLVALRLRGTDNSRPWGLLLPLATVTLTDMARLLPAPYPFHTHPGELSLGTFLHQAQGSEAPLTPSLASGSLPTTSLLSCLLSLTSFLPF